jgi:ribonuclease D
MTFEQFCEQHVNFAVVDSDRQLTQVLDELRARRAFEVSVDIETTGLSPITGAISLMQIGFRDPEGNSRQWLVDGFACDLSQVRPLLASPRCTKLIQYSGFETNFAKVQLNTDIVNVFDPHAAWAAIRRYLGGLSADVAETLVPGWYTYRNNLQELVASRLRFTIPKDERVSDWGQRPLTDEQLRYAAVDAAVLPFLADDTRRVLTDLEISADVVEEQRSWSMFAAWGRDKLDFADDLDGSQQVANALASMDPKPSAEELIRQMRRWPLTYANRQRLLAML